LDHKEQKHQHHQKEREIKIEHEKEHERQEEGFPRRIHPVWFMVMGAVLIIVIVAGWTLLF